MNLRQVLWAALTRDPDLMPKLKETLRHKLAVADDGSLSSIVQVAGLIEPVLEDAVRKRPSRLGELGLKSARLLAGLASEDERSNHRLAEIARGGTVGIVFVDVAGFTTFTAEHGDRAATELIGRVEELILRAARPAGGELVKSLGDGFLLAFPSASQAVRAAVALAAAVTKRHTAGELPLNVRVAVHAGAPLIEGDDLLGHDVNLAARLLEHCRPGRVIVSEAAKELAERRLRAVWFRGRRVVRVRGLSSKVVVYEASSRPIKRYG